MLLLYIVLLQSLSISLFCIINITAAWAVDREFEYIEDPLEMVARGCPGDARGTPGDARGMPRGCPGDAPGMPRGCPGQPRGAPGPGAAGGGPGGGLGHFGVKIYDVPFVSEAIYV